jgi:AraC-like DNA-binding protein
MDADRSRIAVALDRWLAAGCRRACPGWGSAPAEPEATVSGSTRLVLALNGKNRMRLPQGEAVGEVLLRAGEVAVVCRLAWNRPLHLHPMAFLTIDLRPDFIRFHLSRRSARTGGRARVTTVFLQGGADLALRAAADAAEALAPAGGRLLADAAHLAVACARRLLDRPLLVKDPAWMRLRAWIDEHLHLAIGRDDAAHACGIHPSHVSRVVARATGGGFSAWLSHARARRARDLLSGSDLSVAEVGRRCGFTSSSYFSHAFRAEAGVSPGRWRQSARNGCPAGWTQDVCSDEGSLDRKA